MSFILPKQPSIPALPKPIKPVGPPTVDKAQQEADQELAANKRKGAMANVFTDTNTGTQLGAPSQEGSLKRVLG